MLSTSLLLTWHLLQPFSSILTSFGLSAVSGLVSAADKAIRAHFDLRPDLDPIFDLAKKIVSLY